MSTQMTTDTFKGTPGPWGWYNAWQNADGIHSVRLGNLTAGQRQTVVRAAEDDADIDLIVSPEDARLIAAAPELLEALLALVSARDGHFVNVGKDAREAWLSIEPWPTARAAIAKALGS